MKTNLTYYAIMDLDTKEFKARGNLSGWSMDPTELYSSLGRALAAAKSSSMRNKRRLVVIPVDACWNECDETTYHYPETP